MALQRLARRRWLIADVHHLDRGRHLTHPLYGCADSDLSAEASLAAGRFDLALLHGAAATADHRAHTLTDPDQRAAAERAAAQWRQRARRLAAELAGPDHPSVAGRAQTPDRPAGYQLQLLGPPPGDDHARKLWHAAATLLDDYRTKWNVTDVFHRLGQTPTDGRQRDDRQHTLTRISKLVREIAAAELNGPIRQPPGHATAAEVDGP